MSGFDAGAARAIGDPAWNWISQAAANTNHFGLVTSNGAEVVGATEVLGTGATAALAAGAVGVTAAIFGGAEYYRHKYPGLGETSTGTPLELGGLASLPPPRELLDTLASLFTVEEPTSPGKTADTGAVPWTQDPPGTPNNPHGQKPLRFIPSNPRTNDDLLAVASDAKPGEVASEAAASAQTKGAADKKSSKAPRGEAAAKLGRPEAQSGPTLETLARAMGKLERQYQKLEKEVKALRQEVQGANTSAGATVVEAALIKRLKGASSTEEITSLAEMLLTESNARRIERYVESIDDDIWGTAYLNDLRTKLSLVPEARRAFATLTSRNNFDVSYLPTEQRPAAIEVFRAATAFANKQITLAKAQVASKLKAVEKLGGVIAKQPMHRLAEEAVASLLEAKCKLSEMLKIHQLASDEIAEIRRLPKD